MFELISQANFGFSSESTGSHDEASVPDMQQNWWELDPCYVRGVVESSTKEWEQTGWGCFHKPVAGEGWARLSSHTSTFPKSRHSLHQYKWERRKRRVWYFMFRCCNLVRNEQLFCPRWVWTRSVAQHNQSQNTANHSAFSVCTLSHTCSAVQLKRATRTLYIHDYLGASLGLNKWCNVVKIVTSS